MSQRLEFAPHPEELSQRISQIDLTNIRRRSDTITSSDVPVNPRYTRPYLLAINSDTPETLGVNVPPSTPNILPTSPPNEDEITASLNDIQAMQADQPATTQPAVNQAPGQDGSVQNGSVQYPPPQDVLAQNSIAQNAPRQPAVVRTASTQETRSIADRLKGIEMPVTTKQKIEESKKGKSKKPAPTGFEGLLIILDYNHTLC